MRSRSGLAIGRTTVFCWVGDMPRPARCVWRPGPAHQLGTRAMQARYKRERDEARELGYWEFPRLCAMPTFRDFVGMYIAEGYKRNRNVVSLGNSDPAVIRLADYWIRYFTRRQVDYQVQHHADQRMSSLAAFWADLLDVPPSAIKFQRKSNSRQLAKRTWRSKYGVLAVRTGDTIFRARLQGWLDHIQTHWLDLD